MKKIYIFILIINCSFVLSKDEMDKISFKCDSSGRLTKFISPLDPGFSRPVGEKCKNCTEDLDKIVALGQENMEIVQLLLKQEATNPMVLPKLPILCSEAKKKIGPDNFIFKDSKGAKKIKLYYPYNTPYSYVMGYQPREGAKDIPLPDYDQVKQLIEKSVAMGVDPYLAVSVAQMENPFGYNLLHQHIHDKTAAEVLGCDTSTQGRATRQIKEWAYDLSEFEKLREVMNSHQFANSKRIEVKEGMSYLCVGDYVSDEKFFDLKGITIRGIQRDDRYCCMKLPVSISSTQNLLPTRYRENVNTEYVSNLILFQLLKTMQKKDYVPDRVSSCAKNKKNINSSEYRIQGFLGFSTNTGTGMPHTLANWRLGVNSCTTPTYGIQAMDYMVNTLMPNPLIQKLVSQAETKFKKFPKHHLCLGKEGLSQTYELDHYMKQHKDSVRFGFIHSKILSGVDFTKIDPKRNMQPLAQELVKVPRIKLAIEK